MSELEKVQQNQSPAMAGLPKDAKITQIAPDTIHFERDFPDKTMSGDIMSRSESHPIKGEGITGFSSRSEYASNVVINSK